MDIKSHYAEELSALEKLLRGIKSLIQEENELDRIQKLQLKLFSDNLRNFIERLS